MSAEHNENGNAAVIAAAAREAVKPEQVDPSKVYATGVPAHVLDLERFGAAPARTRGIYTVSTVESFTDLVDLAGSKETAQVWINHEPPSVVAVLNDNTAEGPGWGDHRVALPLPYTPEWQHWLGRDGQMVDQDTFAEHLETGIQELRDPDAATMLEIAQSIHATVNASFKQAKRLDNGETQIEYNEDVQGTAGPKGELKIPQTFTLGIAPFLGEEAYEVKARFKYRIAQGQLRLAYQLERPDAVVLDALEGIKKRLDERYDQVYMGAPATSR